MIFFEVVNPVISDLDFFINYSIMLFELVCSLNKIVMLINFLFKLLNSVI